MFNISNLPLPFSAARSTRLQNTQAPSTAREVHTDVEAPLIPTRESSLVQPVTQTPSVVETLAPDRPSLWKKFVVGAWAGVGTGSLTAGGMATALHGLVLISPVGAVTVTVAVSLLTGIAGATVALDILEQVHRVVDSMKLVGKDPCAQLGVTMGVAGGLVATAVAALPLSVALPVVVGAGLAGAIIGRAISVGSLKERIMIGTLLLAASAAAAVDIARSRHAAGSA